MIRAHPHEYNNLLVLNNVAFKSVRGDASLDRTSSFGSESELSLRSLLVRVRRIELRSRPWQGRVLPLNHTRFLLYFGGVATESKSSWDYTHARAVRQCGSYFTFVSWMSRSWVTRG